MTWDFASELEQLRPQLFAGAMKFCKDEQDAKDLLQDTYSKAWVSRDQFTPGTNLRAWLYTILRNTFINGYRREQKRHEILNKERRLKELDQDHSPNEQSTLLGKFELETLLDDLEDVLGEKFYRVLVLVDVLDKSYKEAASELDIPIGTIMSRLYRARKKSRSYLVENYDHDLLEEFIDAETIDETSREIA